jgi:hypothetical protein
VWHSGVNLVLDVGIGDGLERFNMIYIQFWHSCWVDFKYGCIYGLMRSYTVSYGIARSLILSYTIWHPYQFFLSFINHTRLTRIHSNGPNVTSRHGWFGCMYGLHGWSTVLTVCGDKYSVHKTVNFCDVVCGVVPLRSKQSPVILSRMCGFFFSCILCGPARISATSCFTELIFKWLLGRLLKSSRSTQEHW